MWNLLQACRYISDHSQAEVVIVEGALQLKKYIGIASQLSHLKAIVVYGGDAPVEPVPSCTVPVYTWADWLKLGKVLYSHFKLHMFILVNLS
jgi:hypothetical protein